MSLSNRRLLAAAAGTLVFACAFFAGIRRYIPLPRWLAAAPWEPINRNAYEPRYKLFNGDQLVMVYVGSSHCAWANSPHLASLVERAKLALQSQAHSQGWSFEAIGIAVDWVPEEGVDHLRQVGRFDELSTGLGWANALAREVFSEDLAQRPATPEVLVLRRTLNKPDSMHSPLAYVVSNQRLLARKAGLAELRRWIGAGARVELSAPAAANRG